MENNQWWVWLIFGAILVIIIGFMGFSYFKDKKKNKEILKKKIELKQAKEKNSKSIVIKINIAIERNREELENFVPSVGKIKMKDLNNISKKILKDITSSSIYKIIYIKGESDKELIKNIDNLISIKSNLWDNKASNSIDYFSKLNKSYESDLNYKEIYNEERKNVDEYYSNLSYKNINVEEL